MSRQQRSQQESNTRRPTRIRSINTIVFRVTLKIIENRTETYIAVFISTPLNYRLTDQSLVIAELVRTESGAIRDNVFESSSQLMASINERRDTSVDNLLKDCLRLVRRELTQKDKKT